MMTQKEFYKQLADTTEENEWHLERSGEYYEFQLIRVKEGGCCPIMAIANLLGIRHFSLGDWSDAGVALGIGQGFTYDLVCAADQIDGHNPKIRSKLLAVVGLSAEKEGDATPKIESAI